jgi:hypothetical protein
MLPRMNTPYEEYMLPINSLPRKEREIKSADPAHDAKSY